jgi:hypothetical protein
LGNRFKRIRNELSSPLDRKTGCRNARGKNQDEGSDEKVKISPGGKNFIRIKGVFTLLTLMTYCIFWFSVVFSAHGDKEKDLSQKKDPVFNFYVSIIARLKQKINGALIV